MQALEELELPPWEKLRRFGIFPTKLCIHFTLVVLSTMLSFVVNHTFAGYSRSMWSSTASIFFPDDYTDFQSALSSPYQYYIFTQNQTIKDSNLLVESYFNLPRESVNKIAIYDESSSNEIWQPYVKVYTTTGTTSYHLTSVDSDWPLNIENINFDDGSLQEFFWSLKRMSFNFNIKSYGTSDDLENDRDLCFMWKLSFVYDLSSSGDILVTSKSTVESRCHQMSLTSFIYVISFIVLLLAFWYQALILKAICRQIIILNLIRDSAKNPALLLSPNHDRQNASRDASRAVSSINNDSDNSQENQSIKLGSMANTPHSSTHSYTALQHRNQQDSTDGNLRQFPISRRGQESEDGEGAERWRTSSFSQQVARSARESFAELEEEVSMLQTAFDALSWSDIFTILNLWVFVSTMGNIFALILACRVVFYRNDVVTVEFMKASLGVATLMYWFSLVQYLEFFPRYYIMISMLKSTAPRVTRFLLGVLPLFIGYALLGMVCFGDEVDRFGDMTQTLRSLFSVVNGDIIYDTFNSVSYLGFGGQIYIYVYIMIFTYVVLMTIIAIVEEAFFEAQNSKAIRNFGAEQEKPAAAAARDSEVSKPSQIKDRDESGNEAVRPSESEVSDISRRSTQQWTIYNELLNKKGGSEKLPDPMAPATRDQSILSRSVSNPATQQDAPPPAVVRTPSSRGGNLSSLPDSAKILSRQSSRQGVPDNTIGKRPLPENVVRLLQGVDKMEDRKRRATATPSGSFSAYSQILTASAPGAAGGAPSLTLQNPASLSAGQQLSSSPPRTDGGAAHVGGNFFDLLKEVNQSSQSLQQATPSVQLAEKHQLRSKLQEMIDALERS